MKSRVIDVFKAHGEEIKNTYKSSDVSVRRELAEKYNISYNSMLIVLELLGFSTTIWANQKARELLERARRKKVILDDQKFKEASEILQ